MTKSNNNKKEPDQPAKPSKEIKPRIEGIVTPEVLKAFEKRFSEENHEAIKEMLVAIEPHFVQTVYALAGDRRDKLKAKGIDGPLLSDIFNAICTAAFRGFMMHREAISQYDSKKLNEMYGMDYDAYLDDLIAAGLKKQTEEKAKNPTASMEPEGNRTIKDMLDED